MAVSKRLRFEVLRRDSYTCRYCGGQAPDVVITIDHVVPVALGGRDEPANLVAACIDCNAGKTSSAPDQETVEAVNKAAQRWSAAMQQAADELQESVAYDDSRVEVYDAVLDCWPRYYWDRIPDDFADSVDQFLNAGLPADVIVEMANLAATKPGIYKRWPYFCGCCWTKVRQMQERAAEIMSEGGE